MKRKIVRSVAAAVVCASLLLAHTSCSDNKQPYNNLVENVSEDGNINFNEVCYFASWVFGEDHHVAIVGYKKPSIFANKFERAQKFYMVDYIVDSKDFLELQNVADSFEAMLPFSDDVLNKLNFITENYEPDQTTPAELKDNGYEILSDLVK